MPFLSWKWSICPKQFFLEKIIIIILIYLLAPFIVQNWKKTLRIDPGYEDVPFSGPKWPICSEQNIFGTNYCYYFYLPISPFLCVKFKKLLTADPELWRCAIFRPKMVHLSQTIFFFWENYYYHSHLPISPLHFAKFKKASSSGSRVKRMCNFWAQNGPFPQMRNVTHNYIWAPNRKN